MAIVGLHGNEMPFIMGLDTPSNASVIQQMLKESEAINLYPEAEVDPAEEFSRQLRETYGSMYDNIDEKSSNARAKSEFLEQTKADFLTLAMYQNMVQPVLEMQLATSREKDVATNALAGFVKEEGVDNLLDMFRYKNLYLAEIAHSVDKAYDKLLETVNSKVKEGLPMKDVCEIEDKDIKKFLVDSDGKVPRDITGVINRRVQGAIDDFVDDKKKSQFQIKKIYDKAREKVDQYNQAQQAMNMASQTDAGTGDSMDPEVSIDNNLNAKLDAQNQQDIMAQNDPNSYNPTQISSDPGVGLQTPQQEAMAWAKSQENEILESNYNIFDAMMRVVLESAHRTKAIREQYMDTNTNKISFKEVFNDTRAMYTVLEALNTLNVIPITEEYLAKMIHEMYADAEAQTDKLDENN